jgi:glycerophosphoryl diester phosphodiesterase
MLLLGHRGSPRQALENTLSSFVFARQAGLDGVELDVQRGFDGALHVHHDPHLADGRLIAALHREEVETTGVSLLADILEWAKADGAYLNIEVKMGLQPDNRGQDTAKLLQRLAFPCEQCIVSSFDPRVLWQFRASARRYPTALLFTETTAAGVWSPYLGLGLGINALHPHHRLVNGDLLRFAHDRGWKLNTWTVNDPLEVARLHSLGVDGLIGDVPEVLLLARAKQ